MNPFAKILKEERGVTLIELLAVLVISSIILGSMYGAFLMGVNLYKKIGIESQLRDEADFIIANILNDLNSIQPDAIVFDTDLQTLNLYSIDLEYDSELLDYITTARDYSKINASTIPTISFFLQERASSTPTEPVKYDVFKGRPSEPESAVRINGDAFYLMQKETATIDTPILQFSCTQGTQRNGDGDLVCEAGIIQTHFLIGHEDYSNEESRLYVEPKEFKSEFGY